MTDDVLAALPRDPTSPWAEMDGFTSDYIRCMSPVRYAYDMWTAVYASTFASSSDVLCDWQHQ